MATFQLSITPEQNYATSLASEGTAGEDLLAGSICYLNDDGKYYLASATNIKCKDRELRLVIRNMFANTTYFLLEQGYITLISSFTLGQVYYLSETAGEITTTKYDNGSIIRYVGTAESTSKLRFNPDNIDNDFYLQEQITQNTNDISTKADLNGNPTERFQVDDAVNPNDAVNKKQFDEYNIPIGEEFYFDENNILRGNISINRQVEIFLTGDSQTITLDFEPTFIYSVSVNGLPLIQNDYIYTSPDEIEILGTLENEDTIEIIYDRFANPPIELE